MNKDSFWDDRAWILFAVGGVCFIVLLAVIGSSDRNVRLQCEDEFPDSDCCGFTDGFFEAEERECCEKCESFGMKYSNSDKSGWGQYDCYCWDGNETVKLY